MAWCGTEDPYAPPADIASLREEMTTAEAAFQIHEFGKVAHGFTDPDAAIIGQPGVAYNAVADAVSWAGTLALMETVLKPDVT
jgi:dienelactone hydrolase